MRSQRKFFTLIALPLSLVLIAAPLAAKKGNDDADRSEFRGLIESRPASGRVGVWVIGGRSVTADADTEFDEEEGLLNVGSCAKVDIRQGRVHEIDSEPAGDCD